MKLLPKTLSKNTLKKKHFAWSEGLEKARGVADEFGLEVFLSEADYQIAKVKGEGVCLVIYPHTNSNMTTNLRVRDEQSKDARKALSVADALYNSVPLFNTFYMKARHKLVDRI